MKLITYLTFAGNCEEALNFYKEALGVEVVMVSPTANLNKNPY